MPRPRQHDKHLPSNLLYRHGAYYYVKGKKWQRLSDNYSDALQAYARIIAETSKAMTAEGTLGQLLDVVLKNKKKTLTARSLQQYESAAKRLKALFPGFEIDDLKPRNVKRMRREMVGMQVTFNTCLTLLRQAMEYAVDEDLIDYNPCTGTKSYTISNRDRDVRPDEFSAIWAKATQRLQSLMDLCLLTGQRVNAVLQIRQTDVREDGIFFPPFKTKGAPKLVRWSPELRALVSKIRETRHIKATTLLHTLRGQPLDYGTIGNEWRAACKAAAVPYTQMRDLRAMSLMAIRKQKDKKAAQDLAGHKTEQMTDQYLRDRETVVVYGPSFPEKN